MPDFNKIIPENHYKTYFMMMRESLYLLAITVICFVMRQRWNLPEFFGCELHANPDQVGMLANENAH